MFSKDNWLFCKSCNVNQTIVVSVDWLEAIWWCLLWFCAEQWDLVCDKLEISSRVTFELSNDVEMENGV